MDNDNIPEFGSDDPFLDHEIDMLMDKVPKDSKNNPYSKLIDAIFSKQDLILEYGEEYLDEFNSISSLLISGLTQRGIDLELTNNLELLDYEITGDERLDTSRIHASCLSVGLICLLDDTDDNTDDKNKYELIIEAIAELLQENKLDYFTKSCYIESLRDILGEEKLNDLLLKTLSFNEEIKIRNEKLNKYLKYNENVNNIISEYFEEIGLPKIHDEYSIIVSILKYISNSILEPLPPSDENIEVVMKKLNKSISLIGIDLDLQYLVDRFYAASEDV